MARLTVTGSNKTGKSEQGFTLLGLLFLVAGLGIAMAALGTMWHTAVQREKEKELLFIGNQYRQALDSFWKLTPPGGVRRLPKSLDELLTDPRYPNAVRHLRKIYRDPMTGNTEWGMLLDENGGILGIHSLSDGNPFKRSGFAAGLENLQDAASYRDWIFRVNQTGTQ